MEISKQELQELLTNILLAANATPKPLNPLEQKEYDEKVKAEKRKAQAMVHMARIESEAQKNKRYGCTHSRYANGHRLAGYACPKGQGEWVTQAQMHNHGIASMICQRCSTIWLWKPSAEEIQAIIDGALVGSAPPEESKCLTESCPYCNVMFTKEDYTAKHNEAECKAKHEKAVAEFSAV